MKRFLLVACSAALALAACTINRERPFDESPESTDAGLITPEDPTDFSFVYAHYFGPGTPGHCGDSSCHDASRKGFVCGDSKDACFDGLVRSGLVTPDAPLASPIGDPKQSVLAWFGEGGGKWPMPKDDPSPNVEAARAITRWLEAGAKNRGGGTKPFGAFIDGGATEDASVANNDASATSTDGGRHDAALGDANIPAPTWTHLYAYYFGPATPGHCGDCHHSTYPGFQCGSSKYSCYQGMVAAGLIDTQNPTRSQLGDPARSPLSWLGGNEPRDTPSSNNPTAAALVRAWVAAGAQFN